MIAKLLEMGVEVTEESEGIRVRSQLENLKAVHVKNLATSRIPDRYAGSIYSLNDCCKGESTMVETVFENRFQHLEEMRRMGLHSEIIRHSSYCWGTALQGLKFYQRIFALVLLDF